MFLLTMPFLAFLRWYLIKTLRLARKSMTITVPSPLAILSPDTALDVGFFIMHTRGEQSSVITEITDQKPKPEPEPNRTNLVGFRFYILKIEPDRTEPNLSPYSNSI